MIDVKLYANSNCIIMSSVGMLQNVFTNMSNAFISTLDEIGKHPSEYVDTDQNQLAKTDRMIYLSLLVILLLLVGHMAF